MHGCLCVRARAPQLRVWPACIARTRTCPAILVRTGRARSSSTLVFTTWRAVCRLTQVLRGRWAKRGELRGTARARAWPRRCPRRGVCLEYVRLTPPPQCRSCLLYENRCPAMDSRGVMGMFWGLSAGARTARSLWGWTVDKEIYIYICPLLPRRARGVCTLWI